MAHSQRRAIEVFVETPDGQPANGVPVRFQPSEGVVTQAHNETHNGLVAGQFEVSPGSDQPRTATILVSVENVDITVISDVAVGRQPFGVVVDLWKIVPGSGIVRNLSVLPG